MSNIDGALMMADEEWRRFERLVHPNWKNAVTGQMLFFRWPSSLGCFWWRQVVGVLDGLSQADRDAALDLMVEGLTIVQTEKRGGGRQKPSYQPPAKALDYLLAAGRLRREVTAPAAFLEQLKLLRP